MSFEFTSDVLLTDVQWASLRRSLEFRFVVLPETNPRKIRVRWDVTSHRSEWAEDITISADPGLRVSVHFGDERGTSELVDFVEYVLQPIELTPTSTR